jgi:uncharacterized membrane protein YuzA (DUF378 family)
MNLHNIKTFANTVFKEEFMKTFLKWLMAIALTLVLIGGLNWLLIGLFNFNLVAAIFMNNAIASRIVYSLVGFSALAVIADWIARLISRNR